MHWIPVGKGYNRCPGGTGHPACEGACQRAACSTSVNSSGLCLCCVRCCTHCQAGIKALHGEPGLLKYGIDLRYQPKQGEDELLTKLTCWQLAKQVLPHSPRVILHGPPGTGKTTSGQILAKSINGLLIVVTMTEDTPMSELRGHYLMKGGEMVWHDGPITRWWREKNSVLVINEINMAGGDVQGYLHGALDDPERAYMTLPTGETITPSGGQRCIATINGEPEELLPAIRDRFPVCIHIDQVNPEALLELPGDLRDIAANSTVATDTNRRVSIRAFFEFAQLRKKVVPEIAAQAIFGARAGALLDAIRVGAAGGHKS